MKRETFSSSVGITKIRQTTSSASGSRPACCAAFFATATTFGTSYGASQLMITPSAALPANASIFSCSAPTKIRGASANRRRIRKPRTPNVSLLTRSPVKASRRNASVSRTRVYGLRKPMPFQFSTIAGELAPMPNTNRPPATSATPAAACAIVAGPRTNTFAIAVPKRNCSVQERPRAAGTNGSMPSTSIVQASV